MYVMLHTRIRQLPGSGRVVTTGYPDPVPGEITYPSHLYSLHNDNDDKAPLSMMPSTTPVNSNVCCAGNDAVSSS